MVAVAGAEGGVGATSLAANLGSILMASPERSVVLVDLDLTLGDADVYLDTKHEYTLADLTQNTCAAGLRVAAAFAGPAQIRPLPLAAPRGLE